VPILVKIDQEMRPWECSQMDTQTDRRKPIFVCRCPSVLRPSVICLSVCNVRAPYSGDWNFRQCFYVIWYVGHLLTSR